MFWSSCDHLEGVKGGKMLHWPFSESMFLLEEHGGNQRVQIICLLYT